jgi:hypothetical protein
MLQQTFAHGNQRLKDIFIPIFSMRVTSVGPAIDKSMALCSSCNRIPEQAQATSSSTSKSAAEKYLEHSPIHLIHSEQ